MIHGRGHGSDAGGPVLRPAIWEWLASAAAARCGVMAFASARPREGGAGATVILLAPDRSMTNEARGWHGACSAGAP